ncbi:MAG: hypothetical protein ACM3O7_01940 [Acidobacteriota bacterium]
MRQSFGMIAGVVAVTALAAGLAFSEPSSPTGALTGMWQLNKRLSAAPKRPESTDSGRVSGPMGGGMGGRHGGGTGGRWGGGSPEGRGEPEGERGPGSQRMGDARDGSGMLGAAATIKVDLDGNDVRIISPDGHVRILTPDGKAVERERGFVTVTEIARWDGDRLVVTSSTPKGRRITETFALADDGSGRLVHTIAVSQADATGSRTARWVYDRSADPATGNGEQH